MTTSSELIINLLAFDLVNNSAIQYPFNNALSLLKAELPAKEVANKAKPSSTETQLFQALLVSEQKYNLVTQAIGEGIWSWDLSQDTVEYSPRWKSMIGYREWEICSNPVEWLIRVHPRDREHLKSLLAQCWHDRIDSFEVEYALLHRDGEYRSMHCRCIAVFDSQREVSHLVGAQRDLTEYKRIQTQLKYEVDRDRLTKLPNRQLFIAKLRELSAQMPTSDYNFGLLYLDLDRFKSVNQNFNNGIGDRLLEKIVRQLESCLEPQDILARLGGDEFAILLTNFADPQRSLAIASQIQQQFSSPIEVESHGILLSVSIGIATLAADDSSEPSNLNLVTCLQNAEIAMYQAKANGQACNYLFEPQIYQQNLEKTRSVDDLRRALEQEQFVLYYQPLVLLEDRQLIGFEALIRWLHPQKGIISPGDFIPLAEKTGLITPIGWWVLRTACEQMVEWQRQSARKQIFISVNITGRQLSQPYAGDIIAEILNETGLDPQFLKLEITESEIIENIDLVLPTVEKLKSLGVQLSMDDFGTGYSSLSYLHSLPVDTLKIDRSFVLGIESDRHQLELVKTIIKLAEVFELDLVAEGIETEAQYEQLKQLQCKYGQGYLFSKPVDRAIAFNFIS